jgi:hypothetical protein
MGTGVAFGHLPGIKRPIEDGMNDPPSPDGRANLPT